MLAPDFGPQSKEAPALAAREPLRTSKRSPARLLGGSGVGRLRIGRRSGLLVGLLLALLVLLGRRRLGVIGVRGEGNEGESSGEGGGDRADHRGAPWEVPGEVQPNTD